MPTLDMSSSCRLSSGGMAGTIGDVDPTFIIFRFARIFDLSEAFELALDIMLLFVLLELVELALDRTLLGLVGVVVTGLSLAFRFLR